VSDVVEFQRPCVLLSLNKDRRMHWRTKGRLVKAWRFATWAAACNALGKDASRRARGPSIVSIELPVPDRRRRDPHNYFSTVKPIVDGLVDAGVWPDDTPEWVTTVEPTFRITKSDQTITVRISPRDEVPA
jgi:hypothetical protein